MSIDQQPTARPTVGDRVRFRATQSRRRGELGTVTEVTARGFVYATMDAGDTIGDLSSNFVTIDPAAPLRVRVDFTNRHGHGRSTTVGVDELPAYLLQLASIGATVTLLNSTPAGA